MKDYRWRVSGTADACRRQDDLITEMSVAQNMGADDGTLDGVDLLDLDETTLLEMVAPDQEQPHQEQPLLKEVPSDHSTDNDATLQWAWQEDLFGRQGSVDIPQERQPNLFTSRAGKVGTPADLTPVTGTPIRVNKKSEDDYTVPPAAEQWAQWNHVEQTGKADASVSRSSGADTGEKMSVPPTAEEWADLDQGEEIGKADASVDRSDVDTTGGKVSVPPTAEEWAGLDQGEEIGQADASVDRSDVDTTGGNASVAPTAEEWAGLDPEGEPAGQADASGGRSGADAPGSGHSLPLPGIEGWAALDQSEPAGQADTNVGWSGQGEGEGEDDDEAAVGETSAPVPWMTQPPAREGMLLMVSIVLLALAAGLAGVREMSESGGVWFFPGAENNTELTVAVPPSDDAPHFVEESVLQSDMAEFDRMLIEGNLSAAVSDDASDHIAAKALAGESSTDEATVDEWQPGPWLPLPESKADVEAKTADSIAGSEETLSYLMDIPSTDFDSNDIPWWHPVKLWHHAPSSSRPLSQPPVSDDIARIYSVLPVVTESRSVRLSPAAEPTTDRQETPADTAARSEDGAVLLGIGTLLPGALVQRPMAASAALFPSLPDLPGRHAGLLK